MIPFLTTRSTVMCRHAGRAVLITTNTEALVDGAPALLQTDVHAIVGCTAYSPCVTIRWVTGAIQTKVRDVPLLLETSVGQCLNAAQAPQCKAFVVQVQQRAKGI